MIRASIFQDAPKSFEELLLQARLAHHYLKLAHETENGWDNVQKRIDGQRMDTHSDVETTGCIHHMELFGREDCPDNKLFGECAATYVYKYECEIAFEKKLKAYKNESDWFMFVSFVLLWPLLSLIFEIVLTGVMRILHVNNAASPAFAIGSAVAGGCACLLILPVWERFYMLRIGKPEPTLEGAHSEMFELSGAATMRHVELPTRLIEIPTDKLVSDWFMFWFESTRNLNIQIVACEEKCFVYKRSWLIKHFGDEVAEQMKDLNCTTTPEWSASDLEVLSSLQAWLISNFAEDEELLCSARRLGVEIDVQVAVLEQECKSVLSGDNQSAEDVLAIAQQVHSCVMNIRQRLQE